MSVLVDSSIWVEYFRGTDYQDAVDHLIDQNLMVINDLILAELVPPLLLRNEKRLIALLKQVKRHPILVDWDNITQLQVICLKNGINGVGIPDLIIAQHAVQNELRLFARDKHFSLMSQHLPLAIY